MQYVNLDFTLKTYQSLLKAIINQSFTFQTLQEYLEKPNSKSVILRHDVDLLPQNSLSFAQIQYELGIKGTYYFSATEPVEVPESWDENKITVIYPCPYFKPPADEKIKNDLTNRSPIFR